MSRPPDAISELLQEILHADCVHRYDILQRALRNAYTAGMQGRSTAILFSTTSPFPRDVHLS